MVFHGVTEHRDLINTPQQQTNRSRSRSITELIPASSRQSYIRLNTKRSQRSSRPATSHSSADQHHRMAGDFRMHQCGGDAALAPRADSQRSCRSAPSLPQHLMPDLSLPIPKGSMFDKGKKLSQRITQRTVQSSYRSQYSSGSQYSAASTRRTDFSHAKSTYGGDFAPISLDSVGEDKVRNNTLRLANKTATEAEFMLSMSKFKEADILFKRSSDLYGKLQPRPGTANPSTYRDGSQRHCLLIGSEFMQAPTTTT